MDFSDDAALDTSQVGDHRGRGAVGGLAAGGTGVVGLLIYLAMQFLGGGSIDPNTIRAGFDGQVPLDAASGEDLSANCRTGADADQRADCRVVAVVNSVQAYWAAVNPSYRKARTILFEQQVSTGCGAASSAVGPFYCPADETIYLDLSFFGELQRRFGAQGGPFAEAYVIAHEYGHHAQHLAGTDRQVRSRQTGEGSPSVRLELQADCFAGVWAYHAADSGLITELTEHDIAAGLDAAAAIGDDRIQSMSQGRVDPEAWTHGSAEQRQRWLLAGQRSGSSEDCDTFSVDAL